MATHRGQQRDKPFRDALRMEIAAAGEDLRALRKVAAALIGKAESGDVNAIREVADRLDGKPAQSVELTGEIEHYVARVPNVAKTPLEWQKQQEQSRTIQ